MLVIESAKAYEDPFHIETARHEAHIAAERLAGLVQLVDLCFYFFNNLVNDAKVEFVNARVPKYRFWLFVQRSLLFNGRKWLLRVQMVFCLFNFSFFCTL